MQNGIPTSEHRTRGTAGPNKQTKERPKLARLLRGQGWLDAPAPLLGEETSSGWRLESQAKPLGETKGTQPGGGELHKDSAMAAASGGPGRGQGQREWGRGGAACPDEGRRGQPGWRERTCKLCWQGLCSNTSENNTGARLCSELGDAGILSVLLQL